MDWLTFEHEVRDLVKAFGYEAETTTPSHDFGVDVIAHKAGRTVIVQCKLYGKGRIGGDTLMKLVGSRQYFKATDAICLTTSGFTKQAVEIAEHEDIKLVDCDKLIRLCQERDLTIPSLTFLRTPQEELLALAKTETYIGRDEANHVVLYSKIASRFHAIVKRDGLRLSVRDCGSTNGTQVNGVAVADTTKLNYFDILVAGGVTLTVALRCPAGRVHFKPPQEPPSHRASLDTG